MPSGRRLRNARASAVIRAFERLGYTLVRTKGSHRILRHPEKGIVVIPFHRGSVKTGIILDALKKAQISVEDFEKHL